MKTTLIALAVLWVVGIILGPAFLRGANLKAGEDES